MGAPLSRGVREGGVTTWCATMGVCGERLSCAAMPTRLTRIYGLRDLHFITCSCYRRQRLLSIKHARDVFLCILEQVRRKYKVKIERLDPNPMMRRTEPLVSST